MGIDRATQIISDTLDRGAKSCVFFSGGVDSLVLLYLLKDAGIPVVTFAADWTKSQMKQLEALIFDWNLTLYSYGPKHRYVLPSGQGFSLVDEYGFAGMDLPVIRDCRESDRCLADLSKDRFDNFDFGFDTVFTGALESDEHALTGATWFEEIKKQGPITFVSPLFGMRKGDILEIVDALDLADKVIANTGEIEVCTKCLVSDTFCPAEQKNIPKIDWDTKEATAAFRMKFGF